MEAGERAGSYPTEQDILAVYADADRASSESIASHAAAEDTPAQPTEANDSPSAPRDSGAAMAPDADTTEPDAAALEGTEGEQSEQQSEPTDPEPDSDLRDQENVPLEELRVPWAADPSKSLESKPYRRSINAYMESEVLPWVPDAWVDHPKTKLGYEIPFTREFYVYTPPRPLTEINAEIEELEAEILELLREVQG